VVSGYFRATDGGLSRRRAAAEVTARIAVEQASTFGWERYVGRKFGRIIGLRTFGASAPLKELLRKFRFEPERITEIAKELLGMNKKT